MRDFDPTASTPPANDLDWDNDHEVTAYLDELDFEIAERFAAERSADPRQFDL
jgi:hypothetical protein